MSTNPTEKPTGWFKGAMRHVLRSPKFEIFMGVCIFLIGLAETLEEVFVIVVPSAETHHAILLIGGVIALRGLVDVIEGIEHVAQARDERNRIASQGPNGKD